MQQPSPDNPIVNCKIFFPITTNKKGATIISEDGSKSFFTSYADFREDGTKLKSIKLRHHSETTGARDGNRTHDPSLTKTVRYRCATRANLAIHDTLHPGNICIV